MSAKVKLVLIGLVFVVVGIIVGTFIFRNSNNSNIYTVSRETLTSSIEVSGNYEIAATVAVTSPSKGIITKFDVKNGDTVKKGAQLFYVASTATPADQASAYSTLVTDQVTYQQALNTRRKTQAAVDSEHDTDKNYGSAETYAQRSTRTAAEVANDNAWDDLRSAQAALQSAQIAYNNTQSAWAVAPADGTVVNLQKKVGDGVGTETVLIVADYSNPHIVIPINEVNIAKLAVGQTAEITFDALPGKSFKGSVIGIDGVGTISQGEITYNVTLSLDDPSDLLKPSMTANATIETLHKDDVLTVPTTAITNKDGKSYVLKEGSKGLTEIVTGDTGLTKTEVVSGLSEGDKIVTP